MNIHIVSDLIDFFYYCFILNFSLMCFTSLIIYFFTNSMYSIHTKLGFYSGDKDNYRSLLFNYLGNWKILVIVFNLVPWLALEIIWRHFSLRS